MFSLEKWQQINFLQPYYHQNGGNSTIISFGPADKVIDKRKLKTIINILAKTYAVDLKAAKDKYGHLVGRRSSTPIPLNSAIILIPVKMRVPITKDDGAWGYVVLDKIASCEEANLLEFKSKVNFKDGSELFTLVTKETFTQLLKDGEYVKTKYMELLQLKATGATGGHTSLSKEGTAHYSSQSCQKNCPIKIIERIFQEAITTTKLSG